MPSRRALLSSVSAASATLAGCPRPFGGVFSRQVPADWTPDPGEWAGPGYDQANSGHNPHASPPGTEPAVAWEVTSSQPSVVVAGGTVFLRESESLRALAVDDGSEWYEVTRPLSQLVVWSYIDGRLYDGTADRLAALALDGESVWDNPIRHVDRIGSIVERDGFVYVTTGIESLHHYNTETGKRVEATVHDTIVWGLANHEGVLYALLTDGVAAYDVADDESLVEQWRHRIGKTSGFEPSYFAVGGGRAALVLRRSGDEGIRVLIFDTGGGEFLGPIEFERPVSQIVMGKYTYVATIQSTSSRPTGGEIRAYDGTEERWAVELEITPFWLALADETLLVGGNPELTTVAIDGEGGHELWTYEGAFPNAVVDETIYATTTDDRFVALRE